MPARRTRLPLHAVGRAARLLAASSMLLVPAPGAAQALTADEIAGAIGDKTYQGSMTADAFAEYYAADGTIRGDGYTGRWRAEDGSLCYRYGDEPENCWGVRIDGPAMTLLKDGRPDGSGMLIDGNPLGL